jgi:hypothetical protein
MSHRVVLFVVSLVLFAAATSGFVLGSGGTVGQLSDAEGTDITFTASADGDSLDIKTPTPDPVGQRVAVTELLAPEDNTPIGDGGDGSEIEDKSDPAEVDGDNNEAGDGETSEDDTGDSTDQSEDRESTGESSGGEADSDDESSEAGDGETSEDDTGDSTDQSEDRESTDESGGGEADNDDESKL